MKRTLTAAGLARPPRTLARMVLIAVFALSAMQALAGAPVEGRDYTRLKPAQPTRNAAGIVVTEFFSYRCPHCFALAKPFAVWAKSQPQDVRVERIPVAVGRPQWELAGRAYFALSAMGSLPLVDQALYDAIHVQHLRLNDEGSLTHWVATRGVDAKRFRTLLQSSATRARLKESDARAMAYRIPSVPAVVIDGRYLVILHSSRDFSSQFAVIDQLIARSRRERSSN